MEDPSGFGERLELALKARGVRKMLAVAVALDVDESALSRWRRGRSISVGNVVRLARHLGVSIDWLLTGAGSMDAGTLDDEGAWRSEVVADLGTLDRSTRQQLAKLMRHLAETRVDRPRSARGTR